MTCLLLIKNKYDYIVFEFSSKEAIKQNGFE